MKLTITIAMDNETFENDAGHEAARILRKLAEKFVYEPLTNEFQLGLFDYNGNKVGEAKVTK